MIHKYDRPPVFRSLRKQRWEDRPLQARQWLLHTHGSTRFLKGTPRECKGVQRYSDIGDATVVIVVVALFFVCLVYGLI